jgi:prevent-host-death family protein
VRASPGRPARACVPVLLHLFHRLGNWGAAWPVPLLAAALNDEEPLIRGNAAWALRQVMLIRLRAFGLQLEVVTVCRADMDQADQIELCGHMKKSYSVHEARARFSELLRRVRERGETVVVSYHGEPVAEIRPLQRERSVEARLRRLEERGAIQRGGPRRGELRVVVERPEALRRFLADRDT